MDKPELKKILYAEDEPDIRQIATLVFEAMGGFEVVTCETGETVVERAHAFQPDLVVLDVMMPGVDGPGAMGALRQTEEFQDTPMVFMTAKVMPAELERFKQLGALDVITKPFDPTTLWAPLRIRDLTEDDWLNGLWPSAAMLAPEFPGVSRAPIELSPLQDRAQVISYSEYCHTAAARRSSWTRRRML